MASLRPASMDLARAFALALGFVLLAPGCKQGIGDRCEQNSDCASGFCNGPEGVATGGGSNKCAEPGTSGTGSGGSGGGGGGGGAAGSDAAIDGTPDVEPEAGGDVAPDAPDDSATD